MTKISIKLISQFLFLLVFFELFYTLIQINRSSNSEVNSKQVATSEELHHDKYVVISTSLETENDFYMFYLPITCQAWRRVGFEPIIIMVVRGIDDPFINLNYYKRRTIRANVDDHIITRVNPLQLKVIQYLSLLKVRVYYMRSFKRYEAQLGMLARIFIGYISEKYIEGEDTFVMTSDTDLIPIRHEYYQFDFNATRESIVLLDAYKRKFMYKGKEYDEFQMAHIGMRKSTWRYLLTYNSQSDKFTFKDSKKIKFERMSIVKFINAFYSGRNRFATNYEIVRGNNRWYIDQQMISILIDKYTQQHKVRQVKKRFEGIRLDREHSYTEWQNLVKMNFSQLTDAHCYHQTSFTNIGAIQALCRKLFSETINDLFNAYFMEYISIRMNYNMAAYQQNAFETIILQNL